MKDNCTIEVRTGGPFNGLELRLDMQPARRGYFQMLDPLFLAGADRRNKVDYLDMVFRDSVERMLNDLRENFQKQWQTMRLLYS